MLFVSFRLDGWQSLARMRGEARARFSRLVDAALQERLADVG
jgi:hypothetical protein